MNKSDNLSAPQGLEDVSTDITLATRFFMKSIDFKAVINSPRYALDTKELEYIRALLGDKIELGTAVAFIVRAINTLGANILKDFDGGPGGVYFESLTRTVTSDLVHLLAGDNQKLYQYLPKAIITQRVLDAEIKSRQFSAERKSLPGSLKVRKQLRELVLSALGGRISSSDSAFYKWVNFHLTKEEPFPRS